MQKDEIKMQLKQTIADTLKISADSIQEDRDFLVEYNIDSLKLLVLLCAVEDAFQITVQNYQDLYQTKTIAQLTDWVYDHMPQS